MRRRGGAGAGLGVPITGARRRGHAPHVKGEARGGGAQQSGPPPASAAWWTDTGCCTDPPSHRRCPPSARDREKQLQSPSRGRWCRASAVAGAAHLTSSLAVDRIARLPHPRGRCKTSGSLRAHSQPLWTGVHRRDAFASLGAPAVPPPPLTCVDFFHVPSVPHALGIPRAPGTSSLVDLSCVVPLHG